MELVHSVWNTQGHSSTTESFSAAPIPVVPGKSCCQTARVRTAKTSPEPKAMANNVLQTLAAPGRKSQSMEHVNTAHSVQQFQLTDYSVYRVYARRGK